MIAGDDAGGEQILGAPAQRRRKAPDHPIRGFVMTLFIFDPAHVMQQRGRLQDGPLLGERISNALPMAANPS